MWYTIGKSIGHGSSPTETIVATEVSRLVHTKVASISRTLQVDPETGTVACISSSTEHPGCKGPRGVVRVSIVSHLDMKTKEKSIQTNFNHFCRWATTGQP